MNAVQHCPTEADAQVIQIPAQNVQHSRRPERPGDRWRRRIFHNIAVRGGVSQPCDAWSVKLQHAGRRVTFTLHDQDPRKAAQEAREIATFLRIGGWPATLAKYKPLAGAGPRSSGALTVGAFLETTARLATLRTSTLATYQSYLRKIVADIAGIDGGRQRFNCRGKGNRAWRAKVEAQPIALLTQPALLEWRRCYIAGATDPVARSSAERSAASFLRCARALFSKKLTSGLDLGPSPFAEMILTAPRAHRYQSVVNAAELRLAAETELRVQEPGVQLALMLCLYAGLRKREADLLTWEQVDAAAGQINVRRTRYFEPKTDESARTIDVPAPIMAVIEEHRVKGAEFVLAGKPPRAAGAYSFYRCERTWQKLSAWLRTKGITEQKAIHALRKESGSVIAQHFGIEAARAHLGHRDLATTSSFYVAKKDRREMPV